MDLKPKTTKYGFLLYEQVFGMPITCSFSLSRSSNLNFRRKAIFLANSLASDLSMMLGNLNASYSMLLGNASPNSFRTRNKDGKGCYIIAGEGCFLPLEALPLEWIFWNMELEIRPSSAIWTSCWETTKHKNSGESKVESKWEILQVKKCEWNASTLTLL